MEVSEFDFELPQRLIAQKPVSHRDQSKLLVLDRGKKDLRETVFSEITRFLGPGDVLVLNETKVKPARLYGKKHGTGGKVEILLLRPGASDLEWEVLAKPGRRLQPGTFLDFGSREKAGEIIAKKPDGGRVVKFSSSEDLNGAIKEVGQLPLPPYIKKPLEKPENYQTVYARKEGSVAAPTAGLHFTPELLDRIQKIGIEVARVVLHIGYDTFRPVEVEKVQEHEMHREYFEVPQETAELVNKAKGDGRRIIAVGTTVVRTLEAAYSQTEGVCPGSKETDLFIYPGFKFNVVDALITNFHLPRSSLLMLTCAFGGKENVLRAYRYAVKREFRFFSFGDAMFIK